MKKNKVPELETDRLRLKMWNKKDASELYDYAKDPDVGPHAGWKPHENLKESKRIIDEMFRKNMTWAVVEKESGRIIGSIGLEEDKYRPNISSRELGYSLAKSRWGRGYMTEAAKGVIAFAFEELGLDMLMIRTGPNNLRSQKVIEKCGFVYEGTLRKAYRVYDETIRDVRCYSMQKEEYFRNLDRSKEMW